MMMTNDKEMHTKTIFIILLCQAHLYTCFDIKQLFENVNNAVVKLNEKAAKLAWDSSINPENPELPDQAAIFQKNLINWQDETCKQLLELSMKIKLSNNQTRQIYLLCRGPRFTFEETREVSDLLEELQSIYSDAKICIPTVNTKTKAEQNLSIIEDAILDYLSKFEKISINIESNFEKHLNIDLIYFAAKASVQNDDKTMEYDENYLCFYGEEGVNKMMSFSTNERVLKWLWLAWRDKVGKPMKDPYKSLVDLENRGARRNGYSDIGASWRDELEIPDLRNLCRDLYSDIQPLYELLHGVARFFLRQRYGEVVMERGPIPAHLLGDLWSMNWEPLADLILPKTLDLDSRIRNLNWTVIHMAKRAEDFYQSLGLPAMTATFWRESVLSRDKHPNIRCHGTAADMFKNGDYRLLYCSGTSMDNFYVLHHEMGHIQYYMAYEHQPGIFRQANSAFQETIGDAIMYGVNTPQHLYRLGLINESILYENGYKNDINRSANHKKETVDDEENNIQIGTNSNQQRKDDLFSSNSKKGTIDDVNDNIGIRTNSKSHQIKDDLLLADDILILKTALNKIPQIPFGLLIEEYRWKFFEGNIKEDELNIAFWDLALKLQGIVPPVSRGEDDFDIGAKFHVADNTPYIRYFLSSFLQHQLFEKLCKAAVFGRRDVVDDLPSSIPMMRCDIYGSKAVGKLLRNLMSRGHSQHWSKILTATIGEGQISSQALLRYYRPLYSLLERLVKEYQIPIGW